jgi:cyclophilin family peptidyl-prolyl cis-trans isomerase
MKKWIAVIAALALLIGFNAFMEYKGSGGGSSSHEKHEESPKPTPPTKLGEATMEPGRVVELKTNKGLIAFVLFERDCPKTTARIVSLVQKGAYSEVSFPRVEDWIIQNDNAKADVPGIGIETLDGLTNAKGAVGMARKGMDYNSNTSIFYILKEPQYTLDGEYTVFGRLILGMDVVMKITSRDYIISARIRPFTKSDKSAYDEILKIEAERNVQ